MFSYTSALTILLVVATVTAEPPVRANSKFSSQFQNPEPRAFQPVLLRPLGGQFVILEQLQAAPQRPVNPQAAPEAPSQPQNDDVEVNIRRNATGTNINTTESDPRTPEATKSEKLIDNEEQGTYYIYHPNGLLQKVVYATKDDVERMAFSARLKYENVEPIREPIYTYDPETFVFKRI